MDSPNPYGEALDKDKHAASLDNPVDDDGGRVPLFDSPEHTVTEVDVTHLKEPGNTLACGSAPHGVMATFDRKGVTCEACKTALAARGSRS
jgi:hypothetical protein